MTVFYRFDPVLTGTRVGLTVSRALGTAVVRNRIKRRMRDGVRQELAGLNEALKDPGGVEIVINPKKTAATVEMQMLRAELAKAFQAIAAKAGKGDTDKR